MKIKIGDNVIIIAGKDKGKVGIVKETMPSKNKIVVEDVNVRTIHVKPTQQNPEGGIEKVEKPIDASNAMINVGSAKDSSKAIATKVKYEISKNKSGKKIKKRIAKVNGEEI